MGRTTEVTAGVCVGIFEEMYVDYSPLFGNPPGKKMAFFDLQLRIAPVVPFPFASGGDSGALVLDYATNRPIGLLMSADPFSGIAYRNHIGLVQEALHIGHI